MLAHVMVYLSELCTKNEQSFVQPRIFSSKQLSICFYVCNKCLCKRPFSSEVE